MERAMLLGNKNRSTGETLMNKDSSRSHSLFTVKVEMSEADEKGNEVKLNNFYKFLEIHCRQIKISGSSWE